MMEECLKDFCSTFGMSCLKILRRDDDMPVYLISPKELGMFGTFDMLYDFLNATLEETEFDI